MAEQKGSVEGRPDNHIHQGNLDNGQNPKANVSVPAPQPYSTDDLPSDINGTPVRLFNMPEAEITAFTRSQIQRMTPGQYQEHSEALVYAQQHNLVIDDITDSKMLAMREKANREARDKMLAAINIRETKKAANTAYNALQSAKFDLEKAQKHDPTSAESYGLERKVGELRQVWETAIRAEKDATKPKTEATK